MVNVLACQVLDMRRLYEEEGKLLEKCLEGMKKTMIELEEERTKKESPQTFVKLSIKEHHDEHEKVEHLQFHVNRSTHTAILV